MNNSKKFISILLTTLLVLTTLTFNVFSDLETGLYCVYSTNIDSYIAAVDNDSKQSFISGVIQQHTGKSSYLLVYYDGKDFSNVSFDNLILENDNEKSITIEKNVSYSNETPIIDISGTNKGAENCFKYVNSNEEFFVPIIILPKVSYYDGVLTYSSIDLDLEEELPITSSDIFYFDINEQGTISTTVGEIIGFKNSNVAKYEDGKVIGLCEGSDLLYCTYEGVEYSIPVHVNRPNTRYIFEYNDQKYRLGMGNGSSDGGTLHIDDGSIVNVDDRDPDGNYPGAFANLLIGELDADDNVSGPCDPSVYDIISNIEFSLIGSDLEGITPYVSDERMFNANTKFVKVIVNRDTPTNVYLKVEFDINTGSGAEHETFYYGIECKKVKKYEVKVTTIDELNKILESESDLVSYLVKKGIYSPGQEHVDGFDNITLVLPEGTYTGKIVNQLNINCDGLCLKGENNKTVTLKGGIDVKGFKEIENINFVADGSITFSYGGNDVTVGLFLKDGENHMEKHDKGMDLFMVQNCTFTGYDYGTLSEGYSLISGITNCTFTNCDCGIYCNSAGNMSYSDSLYDKFINCTTGIQINKVPFNATAYNFIFREMEFYNTSDYFADYAISAPGNFLYTKNYYGISAEAGKTNNNIRSAKVEYVEEDNKIYTNPCIRYPEDPQAQLGIDPTNGLFTGVVFSNGSNSNLINALDIGNSPLDICETGTGKALGSIDFGGNE